VTTSNSAPNPATEARRVVDVELLAIDLTTCTRCTGTLANIEAAIDAVRQVAQPTGTTIRLRKVVIDSEEAARAHRFVTSPTIRVGGRDIVFETVESRCDACSDLCGCEEGTSCRVWRYRGQEFNEAPVGLVVEALLREIAGLAPAPGEPEAADIHVPENLRRFFAGRTARESVAADACCPPAEAATCCAPAEKDACCAPAAVGCGCA
jgi:hypothetical protein